jgi:hypothetical protein
MEFLHFESTLKPFIGMCGVNGKNERRMDPKDQGNFQKRSNPHPNNYFFLFWWCHALFKECPYQKQFEEDLALFIAKKLVPLSFVEAPFFRSLVLKQNPRFAFHLSKC